MQKVPDTGVCFDLTSSCPSQPPKNDYRTLPQLPRRKCAVYTITMPIQVGYSVAQVSER
ncbi:rna helicase [Moniliophthora roreri]|nr:rna helicase [Moniliophthora roreri]